jgi:hypothetical protein
MQSKNKEAKETVINDFKNSRLIKALINRDGTLIKGNKQVLNRVLKMQEALLKNKPGESIHGRILQKSIKPISSKYRSASVRVPTKDLNKLRKANMSMTAYATNFGAKGELEGHKSKMNMSQYTPKGVDLRVRTAQRENDLSYPEEGMRIASTKYGPTKLRPFLDYDFTNFQKREPEENQNIEPPKQEVLKGAKAGAKADSDLEANKAKTQNIKNILFDSDIDDEGSELDSPKFKKNNISQEEIEAKMFENPVPKRTKVNTFRTRIIQNIT